MADGYNIENMSTKDWYVLLINKEVLEVDIIKEDGTMGKAPKKCKTELLNPELEWNTVWERAKMKGITNKSRTFMWRFLHNILPSEERLHHLRKVPTPLCKMCQEGAIDSVWSHSFVICSFSSAGMEWMVNMVSKFDQTATKEKCIFLQLNPVNNDNILPCVWIIAESLEHIWAKRRSKEVINVGEMKAKMAAKCKSLNQSHIFKHHATNILLYIEEQE